MQGDESPQSGTNDGAVAPEKFKYNVLVKGPSPLHLPSSLPSLPLKGDCGKEEVLRFLSGYCPWTVLRGAIFNIDT